MKPTTILLFVSSILLACSQSTPSNGSDVLEAKTASDGVAFALSIPKAVFALSDSLQLSFKLHNETTTLKTFEFANQQQFGFSLTDGSGAVVLFYPIIVQPAGSGFVLQPDEAKFFSISSLFRDQNGNFITKGNYTLSAYLTEGKSPSVTLRISVQ